MHHKEFVSSKLDEAIWFYDDLMMIINIPKEIKDLEWNTIWELHLKIIDGKICFKCFGWLCGSQQAPCRYRFQVGISVYLLENNSLMK